MSSRIVYRTIDDLLESFNRKKEITIFIGAGVSKSSGIPLASEIITSLGDRLYNENNSKITKDENVDNWLKNQPFFDPENPYASILDTAFPNKEERTKYFNTLMEGKSPTKAHLSIAKLMNHDIITAFLTTNFDRLMEYACLQICQAFPIILLFDKSPQYVNMKSKRPKIFKLHGDYLYGNIRNLYYELYSVKQSMLEKIKTIINKGPLIVVGYSGGDHSIMDVFDELSKIPSAFPCGIFWITLRSYIPNKRVLNILETTQDRGSGLIEVDDSDSFFSNLANAISIVNVDIPKISSTSHITSINKKDRQSFVAERLDEISTREFLLLIQKSSFIDTFANSEASIDYLLARYEEDGEIPKNIGELIDRYLNLIVNSGYFISQQRDFNKNSVSNVNKKICDLANVGLLDIQENSVEKIRNPILSSYAKTLQLKENKLKIEQIGEMLLHEDTYRTLCFYVGLIEDATHVIKSVIQQSVDIIVLYGRIRPWPETFYKAASLIGYSEKVDRAYVERVADMLLLEFDVERWFPQGAISALAEMGNYIIEQLTHYMLDPLQNTYSREDAALSLGKIGNKRVIDTLKEAAQGLSPRNTKMVVYALGLTQNPRVISVLQELAPKMSKLSENVLKVAVESVGYYGTNVSASMIEEDSSPRVELDRQEVFNKYIPNLEDRRVALALQGQFRENPSASLKVMGSLGWPPEAKDLSRIGINLLSQNKPWEAEVIFAECLDRYPMLHWNYHNLALSYSRQGRPFAARRYYAIGLSLNPDYSDYYNDFAITMMKLNNLKATRHLLVKAISIDLKNYRPWLNMAQLNLQECGWFEQDESNIKFDTKPGLYTDVYRLKPKAVVNTGKLREAIVCLQHVLALNPSHPTAKLSLDSLLLFTGEPENKKIDQNELFQVLHIEETIIPEAIYIEDLPKNASEEWKHSAELKAKGDFQGSLKAMKKVWDLYPKSPDIAHNIALLYASIGNLNDALRILQIALEKWPWDYHLLLNYSYYLMKANRNREAIKAAEKAVQVNSGDSASWYQLAQSYYLDKNYDKASDALREAIRFSTPWSSLEARAEDLLQKII